MKTMPPGLAKVQHRKGAAGAAQSDALTGSALPALLALHSQIVLATNLAESSLTIPDVRYVIDFGLQRSQGTDPRLGVASLNLGWISRASAAQRVRRCALSDDFISAGEHSRCSAPAARMRRGVGGARLQAGRCGRVAPGTCVRLYSKDFYEHVMPPFDPPGIQRLPLENLLLRVLSLREPLGMSATELLQRVCTTWHTLGAAPRQCGSHWFGRFPLVGAPRA